MEITPDKLKIILANLYLENTLLKEQIVILETEIQKIAKIRKEDNHG